jgi:FtsP/CotA-like multicopper oxidase with cupredoxin domain
MATIPKALISRRAMIAGGGLIAAARLLPDPAQAQSASDGFQILRARPGIAPLRGPERETTAIWGYSGVVPGPTLRIKRGEELKVRLRNELPAETSIHWHGVRVPNGMDGTSLTQKPVAPNASFDYRFIPPDAGTYWYRAAFRAAQNRALYGALIVEEAEPVDIDRDVALTLDAWPPADAKDAASNAAPVFTINGLPALDIAVTANERVRLRLINAAGDRLITLRIDRHPVTVVAIDGQPAEPFAAREGRITLSPGNRADLILDAVLAPSSIAPIVLQNEGVDVPIGRLVYADRAPARTTPRTEVKPLPPNPLPARMDFRGALRVDFPLDAAARDSAAPAKPLFSIKRGRTAQLAIKNSAESPSVLHIHGHCVRLLDALDDGWKPFWLDTILCVPAQTTRVAFVADNPGKWLLQASSIGAVSGTTAWFDVT